MPTIKNTDSPVGMTVAISGYGQRYTDNGTNKKYKGLSWETIKEMVDKPQNLPKSKAQWAIPSNHPSRKKNDQIEHGKFYWLWIDVDENAPSLSELEKIIKAVIRGCQYEIYTSKSATEDNPKSRAIIPLNKPIDAITWQYSQRALNNLLEDAGVKPDRANEKSNQLCYLPNRGEFYDNRSKRVGGLFDPESAFKSQIEQFKKEAEQQQALAKKKTEPRKPTPHNGKTKVIDLFNSTYPIETILENNGYVRNGTKNEYRHPDSHHKDEYSASVKDDRVHTLSNNDPLYRKDDKAHDSFSAFTVLENNNDFNAALKKAIDMLGLNNKKTSTTEKQSKAKPSKAITTGITFPDVTFTERNKTKILNTSRSLEALLEHYGLQLRYNKMKVHNDLKANNFELNPNEPDEQIRSLLIDYAVTNGLPKVAIDDHLKAVALKTTFHPVIEWFGNDQWDGVKRVEPVLKAFNFEDESHSLAIMKKWLISAIAALYEKTFSTKVTPVLQSPQTYFKTAAIRLICSLPINDSTFLEGAELDPRDTDSLVKCIRHWIVELGEMESTTKKEQGRLKAFMTSPIDEVRLKYGKGETHKQR